jgi:hypothetical protein
MANGQPTYKGKYAEIKSCVQITNNSTPVVNSDILALAAKTRNAFYKQHILVLEEIQHDYDVNSKRQ